MKDFWNLIQNILKPMESESDTGNLKNFNTLSVLFVFSVLTLYLARKLFWRGSSNQGGKDGGKEQVYGLEVLPQVKPEFPLKLIGNFHLLLPFTETVKVALRLCEEYGDIWKFSGGYQKFVVLNSAPLVQTFLKSGDLGHLVKAPLVYDTMKPFVTNGVLVSKGPFWQGQRKILMRTQSFTSLKAYMKMLNKHARNMVTDLEELFVDPGKPKEINALINVVFLKVISEMITGSDASGSKEFDEYHHNFQTWKEAVGKRIMKPWLLYKPIWWWDPFKKKHDIAVQEMFEFAQRRIKEHRDKRMSLSELSNNGNDKQEQAAPFRSVLDELVDAGVDENQIVDEVNTMLFGGHETGATAIHCFCFAMALNQDIQMKCQEEIDELFKSLGEDDDNLLTYEIAQKELKYLERCILETLRIFPPIFIYFRQLKSPLKIDYNGKQVKINSDTNVAVIPFTLHRNPKYFPEPDKFDPDRFLPEETAKRHTFSFVPFSAGPRNCLGLKFAMIEMKVVAVYILRHFKLTTTDKMEDVPLLPLTTLTPAKDYSFMFDKRRE